MVSFKLLTAQESSPKLAHSVNGPSAEYLVAVLYLAPHKLSGRNLCPNATPGCVAACLNLAGRGGMMKTGERTNSIQEARKRRARRFLEDRAGFLAVLVDDIRKLVRIAKAQGKRPAVRLNGTSDIPWENVTFRTRVPVGGSIDDASGPVKSWTLFDYFPGVQFWDYTKSTVRAWGSVYGADPQGDGAYHVWPRNYSLTYSRSELSSEDWIRAFLRIGGRVSMVYAPADRTVAERLAWSILPDRFDPSQIVNGDATDLRFLDPAGSVNLLRAKGPALRDRTGFVIRA